MTKCWARRGMAKNGGFCLAVGPCYADWNPQRDVFHTLAARGRIEKKNSNGGVVFCLINAHYTSPYTTENRVEIVHHVYLVGSVRTCYYHDRTLSWQMGFSLKPHLSHQSQSFTQTANKRGGYKFDTRLQRKKHGGPCPWFHWDRMECSRIAG